MDHRLMRTERPGSSPVFSFKAAESSAKVKGQDEEFDDSAEEDEEEEGDEERRLVEVEQSGPKKKRMNFGGGLSKKESTTVAGGGGGGGTVAQAPLQLGCQVDKCEADLADSKRYHQRHKVCEYHSKAQVVTVAGQRQRFCQQCSRFHDISEFDDAKRSCRRRLAGHNERRRKHFTESRREGSAAGRRGSAAQIKKNQCRQIDERGITQMALPESHQKFHIH